MASHHDVVVHMKTNWSELQSQLSESAKPLPRVDRLRYLKNELMGHARTMQRSFHQILQSEWAAEHRNITNRLLLFNAFSITGASRKLIEHLNNHKQVNLIHRIDRKVKKFRWNPFRGKKTKPKSSTWGFERIETSKVHEMGITGQGVILGVLEVDGNIKADQFSNVLSHRDIHSASSRDHATTMTSIAVDVAPDADIVACSYSSGGFADILDCAAHFICPEDRCELTPHVINHSYSLYSYDSAITHISPFSLMFEILDMFNIINVVSAGNLIQREFRGVNQISSFDRVISVGATTKLDQLAKFSMQNSPDVVAPGKRILTASGTSCAAPMVAGTIALMMSAVPDVQVATFDLVLDVLGETAEKDLGPPEEDFGHSYSTFPNKVYGNGLINAFRAVELFKTKAVKIPLDTTRTVLKPHIDVYYARRFRLFNKKELPKKYYTHRNRFGIFAVD